MQDKRTAGKFSMSLFIFENRHWVKQHIHPAMDIGTYSYINLYVREAGRKGFEENHKEPSTEAGFNPETDRPWSEK